MKLKSKGRRRKLWIFLILGIVLLGGIMYSSLGSGNDEDQAVQYVFPARRTIIQLINANGRIQPVFEVMLSPEVSGEITELPVVEGQYVHRGDLLCRIRPDMYVSMREQAEASVSSAEARVRQARIRLQQQEQAYRRAKSLHEQRATSDADFEQVAAQYALAQGDVKDAELAVSSAQAALKEANDNLNRTAIYAPVDAFVSSLQVKQGQRVVGTAQMAGTDLMTLADLRKMEARVDVSESDIVRVHVGDTAEIRVDAYPDTTFTGVVTQVANSANQAASMDQITNYQVRVLILPESYVSFVRRDLPSPFKPGMSVSVDIRSQRVDSVLTLPIEAVTARRDSTGRIDDGAAWQKTMLEVVFLVDGPEARLRKVQCGIQDAHYIEIQSGLDDSSRVIVAPYSSVSRELYDGARISATRSNEN